MRPGYINYLREDKYFRQYWGDYKNFGKMVVSQTKQDINSATMYKKKL